MDVILWVAAISGMFVGGRKFLKPDRNRNANLVHWFVNEIVGYATKTYGANMGHVFPGRR